VSFPRFGQYEVFIYTRDFFIGANRANAERSLGFPYAGGQILDISRHAPHDPLSAVPSPLDFCDAVIVSHNKITGVQRTKNVRGL